MSNTPHVILYSAEWCASCTATKQYLDKLGVKYTEKNVDTDGAAAQEATEKSGQTGIPVLDINGEIIVGFDRERINATL